MRQTVRGGPVGAGIALVAAAAAGVALRSVVALEWPGPRFLLGLPELPREGLGIAWSPHALWPAELQALALERTAALVAALLLALGAVAALNALVLLAEGGAARWGEVAVRAALGATPRQLVGLLAARVRNAVAGAIALGALLGLAGGAALRIAWPGVAETVGGLEVVAAAATSLAGLGVVVLVAYAGVALGTGRMQGLAPTLAAGGRATAAPGAVFFRRVLAATQGGTAGSVLLGSATLALALAGPGVGRGGEEGGASASGVVVADVTAPELDTSWAGLLAELEGVPGIEAGSLATPGALAGLGIRDYATAQCGRCFRGGLPLPFWGALADHHAVAPGFFEATGRRIVAGRSFSDADLAGAEPVALVNETFARTAFEGGRPLGRKLRLGRSVDAWYTVVGVVEDRSVPAIGGDDLPRAAVWVSALQQPPRSAHLLLRGSEAGREAALALLAARGFSPGEPRSLEAALGAAAAPLRWAARVALALGSLTLLLALHGAHATALQVTRRRERELAVRRVLGATDRRVLLHTVRGAAGAGAWAAALAVLGGALLSGLLRKAAGGIPALGPLPYLGVAALLVVATAAASWGAARAALRVEPGAAVDA